MSRFRPAGSRNGRTAWRRASRPDSGRPARRRSTAFRDGWTAWRRRASRNPAAPRNAVSPWQAGAPRSAASRWEAAANPWLGAIYAGADLTVDIDTPSGEVLAIDNPSLINKLNEGLDGTRTLSLLRSDRSFTDCRPVSVFSIQTAQQIGNEVGFALDKRRFRANVYADLTPMSGFAENAFLGRRLQIGAKAVIAVTDRDPRCKMITLDPSTAEASPEVLRRVRDNYEGKAGIYGAVLVEGMVRPGDEIRLLDH